MKKILLAASMVATLLLVGCSAPAKQDAAIAEETIEAPKEQTTEPEPEYVETFGVGETFDLPSATFVVNVLEQRDIVESSFPDFQPHFVPGEGERLWYFDITWTNNTSEAVSKECHGPNAVRLEVFDVNGNQMLMVDQPGQIVGQNCSTGLLSGQTGKWLTAFRGLDADFGWAVFSDYQGGEELVTVDPNLKLSVQ